jgi:DNA-binding FrmR family transcriptional regulator
MSQHSGAVPSFAEGHEVRKCQEINDVYGCPSQAFPNGTSIASTGRTRHKVVNAGGSMYKTEALNRLQKIKGNIRGVVRVMEEEAYCIDVLQQILAIQRAIEKLKRDLRHAHLEACVTRAVREENDQRRERLIRELLDIFSA